MTLDLAEYDHPAWLTIVGTLVSYTVILIAMFLVLFGLPYAAFFVLA